LTDNENSSTPPELHTTNEGKIKLCFFLTKTETPFEGMARPFINWIVHLLTEGGRFEIYFILLNCSMKLREFIITNIMDANLQSFDSLDQTVNYLRSNRPDILITDDHLLRLRLIAKIKSRIQIKTCIYVQVLHGIHAIGEFNLDSVSLQRKILYATIKLIPFILLKLPYKRLLLKQDIIIANSQITATLLHTLYGIEPRGVIYPPVNTRIFKFHPVLNEKNQVLLYLGSHPDDTNKTFVRKICKILEKRGFKILLLGDRDLQRKLKEAFNKLEQFLLASDEELARTYSECNLTICPQKWETFGYVAAESICCGTPVLAFNCMGTAEIITQSQMGYLANNEKDFMEKIECFKSTEIKQGNNLSSYLWDTIQSGKKLENILEDTIQ
jgi:glycosyltransferase involved in cell wall biosynthesis